MYKKSGSSGVWVNTRILSGSYTLSGSLITNDGIIAQSVTASLFGTSSWANSAIFATSVSASGVIGLNLNQISTGSFTASVSPSRFSVNSGSSTELVVTGTGVIIGNNTTDIHSVTGSFQTQNISTLSITSSIVSSSNILASSIGINTNTPDSSTVADIVSTTKGILIPRMTTTQRDAISTPASQLLISNTTKNTLDQYNGTSWNSIAGDVERQIKMIQLMGGDIVGYPFHSIAQSQASSALFINNVYYCAVYVDKESTVTGVQWQQGTSGVYTASNTNGVALYSVDPTTYVLTKMAESTNDGNIWKGTIGTVQTKDFSSPVTIQPGLYYIAALYNASAVTTTPVVWGTSLNSLLNNMRGLNIRPYMTQNGQATFPATYTGSTGANYCWTFLLY